MSEPRDITRAGLYVLAYSQVEGALTGTLEYYLCRNPWKLKFDKLEVKRQELLEVQLTRELLEDRARAYVKRLNYQPVKQLLIKFAETLDLDANVIAPWADDLEAFNVKRNEVVHGGPLQTDHYEPSDSKVPSYEETVNAVSRCRQIVLSLEDQLNRTYSSHTSVAALRRLWTDLFDSPIMKFEDFWLVDEEQDSVSVNEDAALAHISSSERLLVGLWKSEFNRHPIGPLFMKSLDGRRQKDLVALIAAFRYIRVR